MQAVNHPCKVEIFCDSEYVTNGYRPLQNWRKKNKWLTNHKPKLRRAQDMHLINMPTPSHLTATHTPSIRRDGTQFDEIKFEPAIMLWAGNHLAGGAMRMYYLAKHIDEFGSGIVSHDELRRAYAEVDVSQRNFQRYLKKALQLGVFEPIYREKSSTLVYRLCSYGDAARAIGCLHLAPSPAAVKMSNFFSKNSRAYAWAAYRSTFGNSRISRQKLAELSGVCVRSQIYYEKALGIEGIAQYAVDEERSISELKGIKEHFRRHAFLMNRGNGRYAIAWRLPNLVSVPLILARSLPVGQRARHLHKLHATGGCGGSFGVDNALAASQTPICKMYHGTEKQAVQAYQRFMRRNPGACLESPLLIPMGFVGKKPAQSRQNLFFRVYHVA